MSVPRNLREVIAAHLKVTRTGFRKVGPHGRCTIDLVILPIVTALNHQRQSGVYDGAPA